MYLYHILFILSLRNSYSLPTSPILTLIRTHNLLYNSISLLLHELYDR